jgi:transcriptional regulator with XRE-family HTH domain
VALALAPFHSVRFVQFQFGTITAQDGTVKLAVSAIPANTAKPRQRTDVQERLASRTLAILRDAQSAEIGNRIKQARKLAGLSQHELGHRVGGFGARAVAYWESGEHDPRPHVKAIVDVVNAEKKLGLTVSDLLYGPKEQVASADLVERMERLTADIASLSRRIDELEGGEDGGGAVAEPF